jgi:hypothetical protein
MLAYGPPVSRSATILSATFVPIVLTPARPSRTTKAPVAAMQGGVELGRLVELPHRRLGIHQTRRTPGHRGRLSVDQLEVGVHPGQVQVGAAYLDAVAAGVGHQGLGGVEPHRLRPQQRGQERRGVVQPEPGRGVHQQREADRVGLGEAEVAKASILA